MQGDDGDETLDGGDGNDDLWGDHGCDTLDGGPGSDNLWGGPGNDIYFVDAAGDEAVEGSTDPGSGVDLVRSSVTFTLRLGLENLILVGPRDLDGRGNELDNDMAGNGGSNVLTGVGGRDSLSGGRDADRLKGGSGKDALDGGRGKDKLSGGGGNDEFVFRAPKEGGDTITDFRDEKGNNDRIIIDASAFKGGLDTDGHLSRNHFQISEDNHAQDAGIRFIFRTTDETLWFDKNGSQSGGLTLIADLQDSAQVTHQDVWLI